MPGLRTTPAACAAIVAALLLASAAAAAPLRVRLAPATPGAVRFTVDVPAASLTELGAEDQRRLLDVDGYQRTGRPGEPALPERVVTVAIPPLGEVVVNGVASDLVTTDDVLLAPQSWDADGPTAATVRREDAYAAQGSPVPEAARLLGIDWLRNQRIARIAIRPAAYEPAARRLAVARRVDVEVRVQPMDGLGPPAEPNDAFEVTYRDVLVNYEQGRAWRRPETRAFAAAARRMGIAPAQVNAAQLEETSVFAHHRWVKIAITAPGLYAVNFSSVRTLKLFANQGAAFDSLRLFTLPGFPQLPEANYCDSCDLREVAIGVADVIGPDHLQNCDSTYADGRFACNPDYFYFFAQGVNGWANDFDASLSDTVYLNHPYETKNYYYLTVETPEEPFTGPPARIVPVTRPVLAGATPVTTVDARRHFEQDIEYWPNATSKGSTLFWEKWFWRSMSGGLSLPLDFDLPGADSLQPARIRLRQWSISDRNCSTNSPDHYLDVTLNGFAFQRLGWKGYAMRDEGYFLGAPGQGTLDSTAVFARAVGNHIEVKVPRVSTNCPVSSVDQSALAWFDLYYRRFLQPVGDSLDFRSPQGAGAFHYDIGPFARVTPPRLFDVTDPLAPIEIAVTSAMYDTLPGGATRHLVFDDQQAAQRRYLVVPDSLVSIVRVASTSMVDAAESTPRDLRAPDNAADYVVIYYDAFAPAAQALADSRRARLPIVGRSSFQALAIPLSALYDQFSGGRTDPAAIRNFLRAAFYNWTVKPTFITFLGDASYDFKNITGRAPEGQAACPLPSYEGGFDFSSQLLRQYATDDWLLNVDDPNSLVPDFYGGRLPVDDEATALSVVNSKLLAYEKNAPIGEYRNRVLLLADDDIQLGKPGDCDPLGWLHVAQTDALGRLLPGHIDRDYIYLHMYPSATLGVRPEARQALKAQINDGVAILNFVGHGSPFKMTDESVFIDSDAGTLTNGLMMPLVITASCDVGKFNDPTVQSLGERLVTTAGNGAVAVISATDEAFSGQNSQLNQNIFRRLFQRDTLRIGQAGGDVLPGVGQYHVAISSALLAAKIDGALSETNNSKYGLMGDAATRLNLPRLYADVALYDEAGAPLTQVARGQTVTFRGHVLDAPGGGALPFDGVASMLIEDSAPLYTTPAACGNPYTNSPSFLYTAGPLYHGDVSVSNGVFEGRFVAGMDATLGARARVRAYLQGRSGADAFDSDGAGSVPFELVSGTAPSTDTQGPRITLAFAGGATAVRPDATLQINLFDESGIMTTGHALQNAIVVTLDDNTTSRTDVSESFRYAADSYQSGVASYVLPGLAVGHHRIKVTAADNLATGFSAAQHRSTATIEFDVLETADLHIERAYLFPNPAASRGPGSGATFVVDAPGDSLNTLIRVYTLSGRLIRTFRVFGGIGQVQVPWDGRDAEGDPLANGTYVFKVYAYGRDSEGDSRADQKAVKQGRFVILNR